MIDPYQLLLELRENKILFSYMDTVAVYVEDDQWFIIGDSNDGELKISLTASKVLRVGLPIPLPKVIPPAVLEDVLTKIEPEFDGLLKAELDPEFGDYVLYYYIHVGLDNLSEDLNTSLIRYKQDKRSIDKSFSDIIKTVNKFKSNFTEALNKTSSPKPKSNIWDDMDKIDKEYKPNEDKDFEDDGEAPSAP